MAIRTHLVGKFMIEDASIGQLAEMTLTTNQAIADTTAIGAKWEHSTKLASNWEMSVSCDYDPADTVQAVLLTSIAAATPDNDFSSVDFCDNASAYFSGSALLTSSTVTKSRGSVDKFSATFKGKGALSYS